MQGAVHPSASPLDDALDRAPITAFQIRTALLCAVVAMLDGFDTQSISLVAPLLAEQWGIDPARFGLIFSSGLFGIMVGQITLGPLADRVGRRPMILLCTLTFALLSLATIFAQGWLSLLLLRFFTGVGLGGATPNIITLTSEIAPPRARARMITAMFAGFPLGAAVGGLISSLIVPAFGWQSVFLLGGIVPLLLMPLLLAWLPESPHFLHHKGAGQDRIVPLLRRIMGPEALLPELGEAGVPAEPTKGSLATLFDRKLAVTTLLLWIAFFNGLLLIYFMMSWLPTVARQSGMALDTAIHSAVFLNLGGALGAIVLGHLSDRFGVFRVLVLGYLIAGLCIALIGFAGEQASLLLTLSFVAGLFIIGGQIAMNAATTIIYPASARATGIGAALAVGRIGSVVGPWTGGVLLALGWPLATIFLIVALPALLTALIALILSRIRRAAPAGTGTSTQ